MSPERYSSRHTFLSSASACPAGRRYGPDTAVDGRRATTKEPWSTQPMHEQAGRSTLNKSRQQGSHRRCDGRFGLYAGFCSWHPSGLQRHPETGSELRKRCVPLRDFAGTFTPSFVPDLSQMILPQSHAATPPTDAQSRLSRCITAEGGARSTMSWEPCTNRWMLGLPGNTGWLFLRTLPSCLTTLRSYASSHLVGLGRWSSWPKRSCVRQATFSSCAPGPE